jgi:hypothetical protein
VESGREFGKALHVCIVTLDAYAAIMARQGVSPLYSRAESMTAACQDLVHTANAIAEP